MRNHNQVLYVVIPCFDEAEVLPETAKRLQAKMKTLIETQRIAADSRILFVDDGSKDQTYQIIRDLHNADPLFAGVKLSHNRGQQNAIMAGLTTAYQYADAVITMDADLQDDIDAIDKMLDEYQDGAEIVFGVRKSRKKDTFFKRMTAQAFYKLMLKIGVEVVYNHSEYHLMSKTAVGALLQYQESNLFMKALVPQLGYKTAKVEYVREKRFAGKSKWPLSKLIAFAVEGVTSFSSLPLTMIWWGGVCFNLLGLIGFVTTLVLMFTIGLSMLWPLLSAMVLLTGVILMALGVMGVYIGKTYLESKHRPRFLIEEVLN